MATSDGGRLSIKGAARLKMTAKEFVDFFRPTNKDDFRVKFIFFLSPRTFSGLGKNKRSDGVEQKLLLTPHVMRSIPSFQVLSD